MPSKNAEIVMEMERLQFELMESKIRVKFLVPFTGFSFEGIKIPSAPKGGQLEIPLFCAYYLFNKGIIDDYTADFPVSLKDLTAALRNEVRSGDLQSLHPFFHVLINDFVYNADSDDSHFTQLERKRQRTTYNKLLSERFAKLVKMSNRKEMISRKSNLTSTEYLLYYKLSEWLRGWKDFLGSKPTKE